MSWNRWYVVRNSVLSSLWIAPAIAVLLAQATFRVGALLHLDVGWIPGFIFSKAAIESAMDTCITGCLSFLALALGSLLVAVQVSSAQLTPRVIATALLRDNVIRVTVGLFAYGLLLAAGARARLDTIPRFVISLAAMWGLLSVVAFLFLIDYAARLLRPASIVARVAERGFRAIEQLYPNRILDTVSPTPSDFHIGPAGRSVPHRGKSGIVLAVNIHALVHAARRMDGIIEFVPHVGDFVGAGEPLFMLHGEATKIKDRFLRGQVAFGLERTVEQDPAFAFRIIVDIAIKAISKAINDPTTAVVAIDQIERLLRSVGNRNLQEETILDRAGKVRMIFRTPNWEDFVQLACSELRLYGAGDFQVARRMRAMIGRVIPIVPEARRSVLEYELTLLNRAQERLFVSAEDLALVHLPDTQGLGGAHPK